MCSPVCQNIAVRQIKHSERQKTLNMVAGSGNYTNTSWEWHCKQILYANEKQTFSHGRESLYLQNGPWFENSFKSVIRASIMTVATNYKLPTSCCEVIGLITAVCVTYIKQGWYKRSQSCSLWNWSVKCVLMKVNKWILDSKVNRLETCFHPVAWVLFTSALPWANTRLKGIVRPWREPNRVELQYRRKD